MLELKSRIDALEIDFEEERIKEYLKRVATAASCLEQNQEEPQPQPEPIKPDNRSQGTNTDEVQHSEEEEEPEPPR